MVGRSKEVTFTWHIETVSGKEGKAVREAQARAIRELLLWLQSERQRKKEQDQVDEASSSPPEAHGTGVAVDATAGRP